MPQTIVVVPCYNEAARLDVGRFRDFAVRSRDISLLMVNDGSSDATIELLEDLRHTSPDRVLIYDLLKNVGKAEAVRLGLVEAFRLGAEFVAFWDADLATPLGAISQFRDVLQQRPHVQLVMGSRVQLLGRRINRRRWRHLLGRGFASIASLVLGITVYDTQCGAKMFRVTPEMEAIFQRAFHSRWIFDVEILARLIVSERFAGALPVEQILYEQPLDQWHDVAGSKLKARDFAKAVFELITIYRTYWPANYKSPSEKTIGSWLPTSAGHVTPQQSSTGNETAPLDDDRRRAA